MGAAKNITGFLTQLVWLELKEIFIENQAYGQQIASTVLCFNPLLKNFVYTAKKHPWHYQQAIW
ncbi:MAG: hypothetical protein AAF821_01815 [Cyanobacteria bacterium P01_D01_bin.156]